MSNDVFDDVVDDVVDGVDVVDDADDYDDDDDDEQRDHHGSGLQRRAGAAVCQLRQRHHLVSQRLKV